MSAPDRIVYLGATSGQRTDAFQAALKSLKLPEAHVISYYDFNQNPKVLEGLLTPKSWLKFDSPEGDKRALMTLACIGESYAEDNHYPVLSQEKLAYQLDHEGYLGNPAQFYFGLKSIWQDICQKASFAGTKLSANAEDMALAFDKSDCNHYLKKATLPVAARLNSDHISCFDDLISLLKSQKTYRVFIKMRYGSSAAGMIALALHSNGQMLAYTTALLDDKNDIRITLKIQKLKQLAKIKQLINKLIPYGLHIEKWLPKSTMHGHICDFRVITVNKEPTFQTMRMSKHTMTNLHLGGQRMQPDQFLPHIPEQLWADALETCRKVANLFPSSHILGIDLALLSHWRKHAIIEVNAFGDHIHDCTHQGYTPQQWQLLKWLEDQKA